MPPESRSTTDRGLKAGDYWYMRAHTQHRGPDGLFWCATLGGELFTFNPVKEEITSKRHQLAR